MEKLNSKKRSNRCAQAANNIQRNPGVLLPPGKRSTEALVWRLFSAEKSLPRMAEFGNMMTNISRPRAERCPRLGSSAE